MSSATWLSAPNLAPHHLGGGAHKHRWRGSSSARSRRNSSRTGTFDAANREVVDFRCNGARIWPTDVASIVKPDLGIPEVGVSA
ncbi:MAG: hypothetical protein ACREN1_07420, partial [Candidatus Dormibacteria bacterium]